jgi:glycosyltransferase involved in cell wall biosynthesis
MRILLFDWVTAGHREVYIRALVAALRPAVAVLAVPDALAERLGDLDAEILLLGAERPSIDESHHLSRAKRRLGRAEVALFRRAARVSRADQALHLHADPVVRTLTMEPRFDVPMSLLIFRPRAHYPALFGSSLTVRERIAARAFDAMVGHWRNRHDAKAVLTLDEYAAQIWERSAARAPAHWLPEPAVAVHPSGTPQRDGCAIFGALAERKGIDLVSRALTLRRTDMRVVLAGATEPSFRDTLHGYADRMRTAGAIVDIRDHWHSEADKMRVFASARCAIVPYPRHFGMSRVLVEAASVGTPVVAHDFGLVGHLVRRHGIGVAVDCTQAELLRETIHAFGESRDAKATFRTALGEFAARYTPEAFRRALVAALGIPPSRAPADSSHPSVASPSDG